VEGKLEKLLQQMEKVIREGRQLRASLSGSWYLDEEYWKAERLQGELEEIRRQIGEFRWRVEGEVQEIEGRLHRGREVGQRLSQLKREGAQLEKRAEEIQLLRESANRLKQEIERELAQIDPKIGNKFLKEEWSQLLKRARELLSAPDRQVVEEGEQFLNRMLQFRLQLENIYRRWLAEKRKAEGIVKNLRDRGLKPEVVPLEEKYSQQGQKISYLEYLDRYLQKGALSHFQRQLKEMEELLRQERFQEVESRGAQLEQWLEERREEGEKLRHRLESQAEMALQFRDLLLERGGFRVAHLEIKDGNPINGFTLLCTNGDQLQFDRIGIDENGQIQVELDHQVRGQTGCGVKWRELMKALQQAGIPVVDVTKDGVSVVGRPRAQQRERTSKKRRERG
jgi:HAMP domain-containing protein